MKFNELKCINDSVDLDDYLSFYKLVRDNMVHPEWLGVFSKQEIVKILSNGGKIWMYYNDCDIVCSMFYIPATNNSLLKHNIIYNENEVGSLGPIMVNPCYLGNGFQIAMMKVFDEYCKSIGKKYIFTKAHADNIYSINNILKDNYRLVDKYENERGKMKAFIKRII